MNNCCSSNNWAPSTSASARRPICEPPRASSKSRSGTRMPASPSTTSATPSVHNMPEVTLNLPGRDQKIEEYKQYLRNLGKAGITYTTYAHMGNGIWTSGRSPSARRVGARVRREQPGGARQLGREDVFGSAFARPRVHQGRDLGELHALHQAGGAGRRRGRRAHRHSPGRSAGPGARRRSALHLRQFRRLQAGHGDREQPERRDLSLLRHVARGRQQADGQGSRRR